MLKKKSKQKKKNRKIENEEKIICKMKFKKIFFFLKYGAQRKLKLIRETKNGVIIMKQVLRLSS